jgi:hypothetical protein
LALHKKVTLSQLLEMAMMMSLVVMTEEAAEVQRQS